MFLGETKGFPGVAKVEVMGLGGVAPLGEIGAGVAEGEVI